VILAALVSGAVVMLAVSAWQLRKGQERGPFLLSARLSLAVLVPTSILALGVGSHLGIVEGEYQPMKIAAAEAQWTTCQPCSFSIWQIGGWTADDPPTKIIEVPHLLSVLATGSWDGQVEGLTPVNEQYQQEYGDGNYIPNVQAQYYAMRGMAYLGSLVALIALLGWWLGRRGKLADSRRFLWVATWMVPLPFIINTCGWLLTEYGRQPWIVQGLQLTKDGASPSVSATEIVISLVVFYLLYLVTGIINVVLMTRYARRPLGPAKGDDDATSPEQPQLPALTY
jgi:cytochrome d ubiquinol oxidase subunit I